MINTSRPALVWKFKIWSIPKLQNSKTDLTSRNLTPDLRLCSLDTPKSLLKITLRLRLWKHTWFACLVLGPISKISHYIYANFPNSEKNGNPDIFWFQPFLLRDAWRCCCDCGSLLLLLLFWLLEIRPWAGPLRPRPICIIFRCSTSIALLETVSLSRCADWFLRWEN